MVKAHYNESKTLAIFILKKDIEWMIKTIDTETGNSEQTPVLQALNNKNVHS